LGSDRKTLVYDGFVTTSKACEYLGGVLTGLKAGAIYIKKNDGCAVLKPSCSIKLSVRASSDGDKNKIKLSIKWHRGNMDGFRESFMITPTEIVDALGLYVRKKEVIKAVRKKSKR
jgi:amphi-Trp domain-containing protein